MVYVCTCMLLIGGCGLAVQVIDNQVVMVRTKDRDGHFALQIGTEDNPKLKNVSCRH